MGDLYVVGSNGRLDRVCLMSKTKVDGLKYTDCIEQCYWQKVMATPPPPQQEHNARSFPQIWNKLCEGTDGLIGKVKFSIGKMFNNSSNSSMSLPVIFVQTDNHVFQPIDCPAW